jgi:tetratricopeptide (TPR) repeat protein
VTLKPARALFILGLFFLTIQAVFAQNRQAFPRLTPDPKALEYFNLGQRPGGYSWQNLAEISLWASGDTAAFHLDKITSAANAINASAELPAADREKAEFILLYMHKNILKSYSLYQTRVDTLFTGGRYNCVSSAVLYMILCKAAGLDASGVMTKDHALVTVHIGSENIDVETTNAYGFDPGNRKEFHDDFGRLTGFSYVPAQNYRDRQTISQIELVSLILNNRIADYERQNNFTDSVPVAIDRAALISGYSLSVDAAAQQDHLFKDPRKDLMDRLFNFGAMLLRAGREEDAVRWAAAASANYPDEGRWQEFVMASVNNNLMKLTRSGRLTEARNFLNTHEKILSAANYTILDTAVTDAELLNSANQIRTAGDGDAVLNAIDRARTAKKIEEKRAMELIVYAVQKTSLAISSAPGRNWSAAIQYVEGAIARFGTNRELEQTLASYRTNLATEYHNRFAAEWNRKNYAEAERILNEGLGLFPGDRQLLRDRETVNRQKN